MQEYPQTGRKRIDMKAHMRPVKDTQVSLNRVKYEVEVVHIGLGVTKLIKASDYDLLMERAENKMNQLNKAWDKAQREHTQEEKLCIAEERTRSAQEELNRLETILSSSILSVANRRFNRLLKNSTFVNIKPKKQAHPTEPSYLDWPSEPIRSQFKTKSGCGCLAFLFSTKKEDDRKYQAARQKWRQSLENVRDENKMKEDYYKSTCSKIDSKYELELSEWKQEKKSYDEKIIYHNESVRKHSDGYVKKQSRSIGELFKLILNSSIVPAWIPRSHRTLFNSENGILVVEAFLPCQLDMPTLSQVRYVKTRNEFVEKHIVSSKQNTLYDSVLYQLVLRSINEIFGWDTSKLVKAVVYNGTVKGVDQATGKKIQPCILSIQVAREEFEELNLKSVNPKVCFRKLKGISSSKLHSLIPVAPVLRIDKGDRRFVQGRQVVEGVSQGDNLAAMDWEDFEHLIRELFEKEFAGSGGEVKVTQASRDGGVDAIVFDPDPIRGGKIVIQAKRYTNTVGVSAVRDLYGTVMNEGANKGILVSTSDYGPDSYKFAKGKPIVLLNGSELLYLLEKHGHKAKIDIKEAKIILAENEKLKKK